MIDLTPKFELMVWGMFAISIAFFLSIIFILFKLYTFTFTNIVL